MALFKSGFITMIGKTNVGKSTLFNMLMNQKISITSSKSQTTDKQIMGIYNEKDFQLIFVDNPGFYTNDKISIYKIDSIALNNLKEMDVVLFVVDKECGIVEKNILNIIKKYNKKIILIINKIDLLKSKILIDRIILSYLKYSAFEYIIPLSAVTNQNLEIFKKKILSLIPEGPLYYPKNIITNLSEEDLMIDLIREKILFYIHKEIPYICSISIENIVEKKEIGLKEVSVVIFVLKRSQKKILIGKNGFKLKKIGIAARKDINQILKKRIYLELWVKIDNKNSN
ncbi:GTPase Era [Candidatus Phytoplasma pini]|uniref:GTPase Era n=1 Tax=Candidatus Phytoplasma pini TaxID=267362 RepID=A0A559KJ74_9MOLU|nr:GTPase Era [Candidatus Phytoplasma pini]TVY12176.1 GTP-binding protein [Candidatus Phytoplasma pini]